MFSLAWVALFAARAALAGQCSDVTFNAWEYIESQGPFGLLTPKKNGANLISGLNKSGAESWEIARKSGNNAGAAYFQLEKFCELAKKAYGDLRPGVPLHILLACDADSSSQASTGLEGPPEISASCSIMVNSRSYSIMPEFNDLSKHSFGRASSRRIVKKGENRHDLLDDPKNRIALYADALREAINQKVDESARFGGHMDLTEDKDRLNEPTMPHISHELGSYCPASGGRDASAFNDVRQLNDGIIGRGSSPANGGRQQPPRDAPI